MSQCPMCASGNTEYDKVHSLTGAWICEAYHTNEDAVEPLPPV
jgi:hypothetical protein